MVRVMLVDDQEMLRAGLRVILNAHQDIEIVAEAGDGISALSILSTTQIDVVLMDLNMPGIDGVETTRRIRKLPNSENIRILVLTTFDADDNVLAALKAGADGFLGKGASPSELTEGILRSAAGEHALSERAVHALVDNVSDPKTVVLDSDKAALFKQLTPRELEIVQLIVDGLSNIQISRRIFISPFTVKTHANRAMMKVDARDRAQLVSFAIQAGMMPDND
ncbi:MAG: response regulator transcription factor [Bifidobacterium sp.]|jgi:DNA-binding NarL/FixJ family response regulator|nr:response regulator transcription factor [Bifidobacterium sp.]MCH4175432.1 response regulator transcription factor [Bifidobacterium sp.]